jgi:hypothetical protein
MTEMYLAELLTPAFVMATAQRQVMEVGGS